MNHESLNTVTAYLASAVFGGISLLSLLQMLLQATTSVLALLGVLFGTLGAYYTFRIQRRKYLTPPTTPKEDV